MAKPTTFFSPFTYKGNGSSKENGSQGIKVVPGKTNRFVLTGTSGNLSSKGQGTVYVGEINGQSTSQGSGSGSWTLVNVPASWKASETSIYGPGAIVPGKGSGGIESIQLAGTYTQPVTVNGKSSYKTIGYTYSGPLTSTPRASNFKSFAAKTPAGKPVYDTFLHSWSGKLVAGNYTESNSILARTLNTSVDSNAFVYDPVTNTQTTLTFSIPSKSHTAFGIWYNGPSPSSNNKETYTIAGGSSLVNPAVKVLGNLGQQIGVATLADYDPITRKTVNQRNYQYLNDNKNIYVTHFEGIYYAGDNIYQMPFSASSSKGGFIGNAYVKRLSNGQFSKDAVWQTFDAGSQGSLLSNDSTAGLGSTGMLKSSTGLIAPFAALMDSDVYKGFLTQAQSLT